MRINNTLWYKIMLPCKLSPAAWCLTLYAPGQKQKTSVQKSTLTPEWNEELVWDVSEKLPRADETMEIEIKDYERIGWNKWAEYKPNHS